MRKFTLLIASLFITIGAMAQAETVDYSIVTGNGATGTLSRTDSNTSSAWMDVFTFTTSASQPATLKLQVTRDANSTYRFDMQALDGGLTIATAAGVGDNNPVTSPTTYTLSVPAPWKIVSYSFDILSTAAADITVTPKTGTGDAVTTSNTETKTVSATDINSTTAVFELLGANITQTVTNFVVKVALDYNNGIYQLESSRGSLIYYSGNNGVVASTKGYTAENDAAKQWCVYKSEDTGNYYLYNLGAEKFLGAYNSSNEFVWVETPDTDVKIVSSTKNGYPFIFSTDGTTGAVNHHNNTNTAPYVTNWNAGLEDAHLNDDGSSHRMVYVSEVEEATLAAVQAAVAAYENPAANQQAKNNLKAAIDGLDAFLASISVGKCISQYSTTIDNPEAQIDNAKAYYDAIDDETEIEQIEELTNSVNAIKDSYTKNVLVDGKFYYIHSACTKDGFENLYIYASLSENNTTDRIERHRVCLEATTTPSNTALWECEIVNGNVYFKNVHTASYMKSLHLYLAAELSETEKAPITVTELGQAQVSFVLESSHTSHNRAYADKGQMYLVPWNDSGSILNTEAAWYIEEAAGVNIHELTVGETGWATIVLGYNTIIPSGVTCCTFSSIINDRVLLNEVTEGVLGANVPVLVKANPGTYEFEYTTNAATVTESGFGGSLYDNEIVPEHTPYILAIPDGGTAEDIGFYPTELDQSNSTAFVCYANKAYLDISTQASSNGFRFDFGDGTTTEIEKVEMRNEKEEIYDLQGRRINEITCPGIYIVNGKKVLVKQ